MIATKVMIGAASGIAEHVGDGFDLEFGYVPGWVDLREQLKAKNESIRKVLSSTPGAGEFQARFTDADLLIQGRISEGVYDGVRGWRARNVIAAANMCVGCVQCTEVMMCRLVSKNCEPWRLQI